MSRVLICGAITFATLLGFTVEGKAFRMAMPANFTTVQKSLQAEVVVVGKVTGIEKESIEVEPFKGAPNKLAYKIAVIKIDTAVVGAKGLTHIKVGFQEPVGGVQPAEVAPVDNNKLLPVRVPPNRGGGFQPITLKADQEGVFYLHKHPTANFYIIQQGYNPLDSKDAKYKEEISQLKAIAMTIADPLKSLKAEKAEDRLAAATTLISKYRAFPQNAPMGVDQVAIPAEETKLILKALVEADWDKYKTDPIMNPMNAISMIGIYQGTNGIGQFKLIPGDPNPAESYRKWYHAEVKKWYETNSSKFEIKKMVPKETK